MTVKTMSQIRRDRSRPTAGRRRRTEYREQYSFHLNPNLVERLDKIKNGIMDKTGCHVSRSDVLSTILESALGKLEENA